MTPEGQEVEAVPSETEVSAEAPAAPEGIEAGPGGFVLEDLPGIGEVTAERLREAGLDSEQSIMAAGAEALAEIDGISEAKAEQIIAHLASDS